MLEKLTNTFSDILRTVGGKAAISEKNIEDAVEQIKIALLEADVNLRVVRRFVNSTIEDARGEKVLRSVNPGQQFVKIIHDKIVALLGDVRQDLKLKGPDTVSVILLLGLQGSGKTTAAAKLALHLKKEGRKPLLAACDLVRPAAIEQLAVLGQRVGVPVWREDNERSVVKVAQNALSQARKTGRDVVILDTAGRLQIDDPMMTEVERVKKATSPDEVLLVADAMTGQSAANIAKTFDERVGLTAVILTKFDSDTRGGAALSVKSVTGKPVLFIGTGEKPEDFEPFHPDRIAGRILGMGDVVSLVEKARQTLDAEEAVRLQRKISTETFSLQDMLDQIQAVKKMGSLYSLLEMIPGAQAMMQGREANTGELKKQEAIIRSMTKKERANHLILGPNRRKRIAHGSGTSVAEVNRLIKHFEQTRLTMKKMTKTKGAQARFMQQMGQTV
ncbi:MAG: signal recognition particle protein [Spirochaetaceae bacterium]|jgi:signal recognition particle subunit SRP54|nr:signal recognition particle protein [Spirochaetaceae bacterium]